MIRVALRFSTVCLVAAFLIRFAAPAYATTFMINTTADTDDGTCDANCTLREAILAANAAGGADTISFDSTVFGTPQVITLTSGLPYIDSDMSIVGPGAALLTITGVDLYRPFTISASGATVSISGLTIAHGYDPSGGGIYSAGTLTISDSIFTNNTADDGGGIFSSTLTVSGSSFSGNSALNGSGGGIFAISALTVSGSSFSGNSALNGSGGGIFAISATVSSSTFSGNSALNGDGGGIFGADTLTITNSTFSGNSAADGGAITKFNTGSLTISGSTFTGNSAAASSGGVRDFSNATSTITNSTFSSNTAGAEGGGYMASNGDKTIINSTFVNNSARGAGGGLAIFFGLSLTFINSTISGNSAADGGGIQGSANKITLNNTIIANSTSGGECSVLSGTINANHSLIEGGLGCVNGTNIANLTGDPLLGALTGSPGYLPLLAGSPAIDTGDNALIPGGITTDQAGSPRIINGTVDRGAYETGAAAEAAGTPISNLCRDVTDLSDSAILVNGGVQNVMLNGVYGNTYCRLIALDGSYVTSPQEIGVQSVIDLGVVDAIDVFGELPGGTTVVPFIAPVTVCLRGSGDVLFLSAADAGRTPQRLTSGYTGGYVCVSVPNSGTVVLVGTPSNLPVQAADPVDSSPTTLANCQVTTLDAPLNLRAEPNTGAAVLAQLAYNLTLRATERVPDWFRVIYLDGQGWVYAQYLSPIGVCG